MTVRVTGHFGEWLQGRLGPGGPIVLVTVPCNMHWVEAERVRLVRFGLRQTPEVLSVEDAWQMVLRTDGRTGTYRINATMPPGAGAGASTAALVALARASYGRESEIASAAVEIEGASDPLMFLDPERVLWASREGRVVADLPPLPRAEIVGGFWGAIERTDPRDTLFPDVSDLAEAVKTPLTLPRLAEIASESARRCSEMRGPYRDPTPALAQTLGGLGHVRAHTGSARGVVFAPGTVPDGAIEALREAGFEGVFRFQTGGDPA